MRQTRVRSMAPLCFLLFFGSSQFFGFLKMNLFLKLKVFCDLECFSRLFSLSILADRALIEILDFLLGWER